MRKLSIKEVVEWAVTEDVTEELIHAITCTVRNINAEEARQQAEDEEEENDDCS